MEVKKINFYNASEIAGFAGFAILFFCKNSKTWLWGSLLLLAVIFLIIQFNRPTTVINETDGNIAYKPEDGTCEPQKLEKGKAIKGIDGIKINNKVYKACDGTTICVKSNGKIRNYSLLGLILNSTRGGKLTKAPDECWQPLFDYEQ